MIQSSSEIKAQLLAEENQQTRPAISKEKRSQFIELGTAVKRMAGTKGWKIVEAWLLRKLDVSQILEATPDKLPFVQAKAQAFAEIIRQVNYWITLAEQLEKEEPKDGPV
jgi:hypothetical protein